MSRALELTVFPWDTWGYQLPDEFVPADDADEISQEKRLTEAMLAAEFEAARCDWMLTEATGSYWSQMGDTWSHEPAAVSHRVQTLLRFASRPHYDEEPA